MNANRSPSMTVPVMLGAAAGLATLLVNIVNVDAGQLASAFTWNVCIGYGLKALVMMSFGALLVYANSETNRWKAFQIGILAPAIITSILNGQNLDQVRRDISTLQAPTDDNRKKPVPQPGGTSSISPLSRFSLIQEAYAASNQKGILRAAPGSGTAIWYGATGSPPNRWFVIVGSFNDPSNAQQLQEGLEKGGYKTAVLPPVADRKNYSVIVGSYLSLDEAKALRAQVIGDKAVDDAFLWQMPVNAALEEGARR